MIPLKKFVLYLTSNGTEVRFPGQGFPRSLGLYFGGKVKQRQAMRKFKKNK